MTDAYFLKDCHVTIRQHPILQLDTCPIPARKCTVLIGDNGAGKSTFLRVLALLQPLSQGTIQVFGTPIAGPCPAPLRQRIGIVDQHPFLLAGSVTDNLKLALTLQHIPRAQHRACIEQALRITHTHSLADHAVSTLSGGERKRVAIARAIVYQPDILLLDEPFSHLDSQQMAFLEDLIAHWTQHSGKTIILSTHDRVQGMALADHTCHLVQGRLSPAPLINIFRGQLSAPYFDTGKIRIHTTCSMPQAHHLAVDPEQIIISHQPLTSSMQNVFQGRLIQLFEHTHEIILLIDCGEPFYARISQAAYHTLKLQIGQTVCLSFKSSAITLF